MHKNNNRYLLTHLKSRIDSLLTIKLTWNSAKIMWIFVALANTCNNSYHERYMVNQTQSPYGIIQNVVIIPKKEFKIIYCTNIYKGYLSSKDSKWMKFLLAFRPPCSVGKIIFFLKQHLFHLSRRAAASVNARWLKIVFIDYSFNNLFQIWQLTYI